MQTLLEILRKTESFFAKKNLEHPRLQAELLMSAALECKRLDLYLQFERPLDEVTLAKLRDWVIRRATREPLQYITGETQFREVTLHCDKRALIPRFETEELVELVKKKLPASATTLLELGTGTGAIAISIAKEIPNSHVKATDISTDALALATTNAEFNGVAEQVSLFQSDWFSNIATSDTFDAIISNPPYLSEEELASAEPEVREYEPRTALIAGENGIADLKKILREAKCHLRAGGFVALETGISHHAELARTAIECGFARSATFLDIENRERFFLAWRD